LGYTGEGRIVCVFDFGGVHGNHPALYNNWKGHDGDSSAAWNGYGSFPSGDYHGTHIMGTMVGHDDISGDTIGVAPGAKWIAGGGFEWAADPDGNPNTSSEMPDVINISWTTGCYGCSDALWDEIDMVEALGIIVIIAAGNGGPSPFTTCSPADRALDSLTNFAVGSIDHRSGDIYWSSSRGPSECDSISIKPNICAPGAYIRSCVPDSGYEIHGGTSMAAPHVAGAVAILRQYAPNATTREIKEALLAGTTPRGSVSPNNDYGWGVLNIPASLQFLEGQLRPDFRISEFDYEQVDVTDTVTATMRLINRGLPADSVYASFSGSYPGIDVLSDSIYFGRIHPGDTTEGSTPFKCVFDDTVYAGPIIPIEFTIHGSTPNADTAIIYIQAGIQGEKDFYTHKTDRLQFTISNFGQYGFGRWSSRNLGQSGFRFEDTTRNCLYEAALIIGMDSNHVSDGFRTYDLESDDDFWIGRHSTISAMDPRVSADQKTQCVFDDGCAENRMGIEVRQKTYCWTIPPNDNYVLIEYSITNITDKRLDGLHVGLAFDWIYPRPSNCDTVTGSGYLDAFNTGFICAMACGEEPHNYRGLQVLNHEGVRSYRGIVHPFYLDSGLTEATKFSFLADGVIDTGVTTEFDEQLMHIISTGPFTLEPGKTDTAAFALIGADSLNELLETSVRTSGKWLSLVEASAWPRFFILGQNYPNPFNSSTTIEYTLSVQSAVKLDIYNILGQRVIRIIDKELPSGYYKVIWDGKDSSGDDVASGVYFYQIRASGYTKAKKMILLK
jgi:hypothetical protein